MIEFSRRQKNTLLWTGNGLLFALKMARAVLDPSSISSRDLVWMLGAAVVVLLHSVPRRFLARTIPHASLFLLTGAALGFTLGQAFHRPSELWILEWLCLVFLLVAVLIHYSPSRRDPYT